MQQARKKVGNVIVETVDGVVRSYPDFRTSHRKVSNAVYEERKIGDVTHYMSRMEYSSLRQNILT